MLDSQDQDPLRGEAEGEPASPETPRWVKVFGLVALVLAGLFAVVHLAGFGLGGHMHRDHQGAGQQ